MLLREKLIEGFKEGYVTRAGLIAHGRGECFDYLIGEVSIKPALKAAKAAAAALLLAKHPVISVNGNVAALAANEVVRLSKLSKARIEVNLFYRTEKRARKIAEVLKSAGATQVLGVEDAVETIPELESERRRVSPNGILKSDVVLVALEDGDRTEALRKLDKAVIAIDLNPLSRTARAASITVVDNVVRALPNIINYVEELRILPHNKVAEFLNNFRNEEVLKESLKYILARLERLIKEKVSLDF